MRKEDAVQKEAGITFMKKVGDEVNIGDCLAIIYANDFNKAEDAAKRLKDAYKFCRERVAKEPAILGIV